MSSPSPSASCSPASNSIIANPNRIRHFAKGDGILAKTDKVDAFVIAEFARKSNLPAAFEASPLQIEFKQLVMRRIELKKNMQAEKCRMRLSTGSRPAEPWEPHRGDR